MNREIPRTVTITEHLHKGKVLIIYGARQVGKTTLVKSFLKKSDLKYQFYTGDDLSFSSDFAKCELQLIEQLVSGIDLLVIDEAQKIKNVGTALKLVVDHFPDKYVIVTGSSSFDLANSTEEPLTGRKNVITLYPISLKELSQSTTPYELDKQIEKHLIYGSYPEVVTLNDNGAKKDRITEIKNSYLIKDILEFQRLKRPNVILNLLKLLAFQVGNQVSTVELGKQLGLDKKTVQRYLDLLEKSFVLISLGGFSRNLRKEVSKMKMYYFMDLGVRNAMIANFNPLNLRNDVGQLWENFMLIERMKRNAFERQHTNYYYWRTYDQKEIDLIEESGGKLKGFEFKWNPNHKVKSPKEWLETYNNAEFEVISQKNYQNFVLE
ncbi:MAG: ATP-binding protein [Balneolaceae bacterium]|nr:ATP-binding protein [Balneolaceae bacterium]